MLNRLRIIVGEPLTLAGLGLADLASVLFLVWASTPLRSVPVFLCLVALVYWAGMVLLLRHPRPRIASGIPLAARARHEAAHAVVAHGLGARAVRVSTIPEDGLAGKTQFSLPEGPYPRRYLLAIALAGITAEGTPPTISEDGGDDLSQAARYVEAAHADGDPRSTEAIVTDAFTLARRVLDERRDSFERLVAALGDREVTIEGRELDRLLDADQAGPARARVSLALAQLHTQCIWSRASGRGMGS